MVEQYTSVLRIPLYKLYYLEKIGEMPLTNKELELLYTDYEPLEVQQIIDSLVWACKHPEFAFSALVPGIKFSDQEAYRYLVNLLHQIESYGQTTSCAKMLSVHRVDGGCRQE